MGNSDCKRCLTGDKEKDSEIKLGPEFDNKEDFDTLIKNAMSKDYSWDKSAIEYIDLYQFVIDNK